MYAWRKEDPEFEASLQSVTEIVLDFAESALHKQINSGNPASTIFFLKTRGKERGYTEKMEIDNNHSFVGSPRITFDDK